MIVRNRHQTAELIRKGRRVDYVYRAGKRILGYEPAEFINVTNLKIFDSFPDHLGEIVRFRFSNIIEKGHINIIDITANGELIKSYLALFLIKNKEYEVVFMSSRWGRNSILTFSNTNNSFRNCSALKKIDSYNFNIANATNLSYFFHNCGMLKEIDARKFNTAKVTNFYSMFYGCKNLVTLDVSNFETSSATLLGAMFANCSGLETLDVSNFNTKNCINFYAMFAYCSNIEYIDISNFDTSKALLIDSLFSHCSKLINVNLGVMDVRKVTTISSIFSTCTSLQEIDLSSWELISCTNTTYAFFSCSNLQKIHTPAISARVDIALPATYYNADGSIFGNKITANSVGSVTIYRTPPTS